MFPTINRPPNLKQVKLILVRDNDDDKQCLPVARTGHFKIDLQRGAGGKTPLSQGFEHWDENWRY